MVARSLFLKKWIPFIQLLHKFAHTPTTGRLLFYHTGPHQSLLFSFPQRSGGISPWLWSVFPWPWLTEYLLTFVCLLCSSIRHIPCTLKNGRLVWVMCFTHWPLVESYSNVHLLILLDPHCKLSKSELILPVYFYLYCFWSDIKKENRYQDSIQWVFLYYFFLFSNFKSQICF